MNPSTDEQPTVRHPTYPLEQRGAPSSISGEQPTAAIPYAEVLSDGDRRQVPATGLTIGRAPDNALVLDRDLVSRHHARIVPREGRWFVADLDSLNGTELNGERLRGDSRWLNSGDTLVIGRTRLRFVTGQPTRLGESPTVGTGPRVITLGSERLTIGRDSGNDVVLSDPNVSRFHAEVTVEEGRVIIRDLGSRNGTRLDGRVVPRGEILAGSEIAIGPFRLVFDGRSFVRRNDRGALRLTARDVTVIVKDKAILNRASLNVEPGEFVAIIGESGSGKTTLIRTLAGASIPTSGNIAVNGAPVTTRLTDIGYVPQDEIVHRHLTVREALRYSAKLRLPNDATDADIDEAVARVLAELALEPHADVRIGSLSGGQRKRAGMAAELLNRPSLLFLDEPTTGLDPGLETQMMELFRDLSREGTRAVILVTHATKNLEQADKLCVMGRGGELAFFGPPEEARSFFGVESFDGIYTALEHRDAKDWRADFDANKPADPSVPPPAAIQAVPRPRTGVQTGVLARRYLKLLTRDRRNLLILLGQVPVIGIALSLLFESDVLSRGDLGNPTDAAQLLFVLSTTAIWLGSIDGSREIIKERALSVREAAIGVRTRAYLFSKAIVLFGLASIQVALLVAVVFAMRPLDASTGDHLAVYAFLCLTAFVAVGMGLLISAAVNSEDQATSFIPLALIPQLLFAGALVSVKDMSTPVDAASNVVFSRWSFSSLGTAVDLNGWFASDPKLARANRFGDQFFDLDPAIGVAVLGGFLVVLFAATATLLRTRS